MRIEDLKRWHWIIIGLLAGLALGYMRVSTAGERLTGRRNIVGQSKFEEALHARPVQGQASVTDLVVYRSGQNDVVKMKLLIQQPGGGQGTYQPFEMYTKARPYQPKVPPTGYPRNWRPWQRDTLQFKPPSPDYSVMSYLQDVAKHNPQVKFRRGWWKESRATMAWWTLGSVVLIGGIWPTIVHLLVGAGYGRPRPPEPEYDLDRFKSEETAGAMAAGPSAADQAKLKSHVEELEEELAANLSGNAPAQQDAEPGKTPAGPAPLRTLSGGPLEAGAARTPEEERDYKGEYYPVARTGGKKPDSK